MRLCEQAGHDLFLTESGGLHVEGQARPDQQAVIDANSIVLALVLRHRLQLPDIPERQHLLEQLLALKLSEPAGTPEKGERHID
jgi:hypothetical protein